MCNFLKHSASANNCALDLIYTSKLGKMILWVEQ